jgi:hypothetical protein
LVFCTILTGKGWPTLSGVVTKNLLCFVSTELSFWFLDGHATVIKVCFRCLSHGLINYLVHGPTVQFGECFDPTGGEYLACLL